MVETVPFNAPLLLFQNSTYMNKVPKAVVKFKKLIQRMHRNFVPFNDLSQSF